MSSSDEAWLERLRELARYAPFSAPVGIFPKILGRQLPAPQVRDAWADWRARHADHPWRGSLHVYLHVPWCKRRCAYCQYASWRTATAPPVDDYLRGLRLELEPLAEVLADVPVRALYLGGGTPSLLSEAQLAALLDLLREHLAVNGQGERTCELAPETATTGKLDVLVSRGINRVSLGVQSTDAAVLQASRRTGQRLPDLTAILEAALARPFLEVNVDLIAGLPRQEPRTLARSAAWLAERGPHRVTLYALQGTPRMAPPSADRWRALSEAASEALAAAGYRAITPDNPISVAFHRHDHSPPWDRSAAIHVGADGRPKMVRDGWERYNFDPAWGQSILGLGPAARSRIFGRLACHNATTDDDLGGVPAYRGVILDDDEEARAFLIASMISAEQDLRLKFEAIFGFDPVDRYGTELRRLEGLGWLTFDGDDLQWSLDDRSEGFLRASVLLRSDAVDALRKRLVERIDLDLDGEPAALRKVDTVICFLRTEDPTPCVLRVGGIAVTHRGKPPTDAWMEALRKRLHALERRGRLATLDAFRDEAPAVVRAATAEIAAGNAGDAWRPGMMLSYQVRTADAPDAEPFTLELRAAGDEDVDGWKVGERWRARMHGPEPAPGFLARLRVGLRTLAEHGRLETRQDLERAIPRLLSRAAQAARRAATSE